MTLEGKMDKASFLREWMGSEMRAACFLQTRNCLYLMPYGRFSHLSREQEGVRFSGTYRRHSYVKRDFDISGGILGGGYLILDSDMKTCRHEMVAVDFGEVPNRMDVVAVVSRELLGVNN